MAEWPPSPSFWSPDLVVAALHTLWRVCALPTQAWRAPCQPHSPIRSCVSILDSFAVNRETLPQCKAQGIFVRLKTNGQLTKQSCTLITDITRKVSAKSEHEETSGSLSGTEKHTVGYYGVLSVKLYFNNIYTRQAPLALGPTCMYCSCQFSGITWVGIGFQGAITHHAPLPGTCIH